MKLLIMVVLFASCVFATTSEQQVCFSGSSSSYIRYAIPNPLSYVSDTIIFKFRSTDASGLLLYTHSGGLNSGHVLLELVRGKLRVQYQLGPNTPLKDEIIGDGLGDYVLSTVLVKRHKKTLTISAIGDQSDTLKIVIPGVDDRLDLNGLINIGGYFVSPGHNRSAHLVNFRGCMLKAKFNNIDFIDGAINNRSDFTYANVVITNYTKFPKSSMNFNNQTFISVGIQPFDPFNPFNVLHNFSGKFDFRTVLLEGTIFQASTVALKFQRSKLSLVSGNENVSIDFPNEGQANDGRWYSVEYVVHAGNLQLVLNGKKRQASPLNIPQFGPEVTFGFSKNEHHFVGCIRNLVVLDREIRYRDIVDPYRAKPLAQYDHLTEGCKASDPCVPNPCFHNALCRTVAEGRGVDCDCRNHYTKPLCLFSRLSTTCSALKKFQRRNIGFLRGRYFVDPDDSGPLPPWIVLCDFAKSREGLTEINTLTAGGGILLENDSKYSEKFSYKRTIKYEIPFDSVKAIVDRSEQCEQFVKYECKDAKLFNGPRGEPVSRWLSGDGHFKYYWGGAERNSYKCACAYQEPLFCIEGAYCNCDSTLAEKIVVKDEGVLNITRDLPVREVQFGGFSPASQAVFTIKKVTCYGVDAAGVVNFVTPDGWIRAPAWNSPNGGDISFYIKTVFAQGDLIDHRNSDESHIFQVRIFDNTTIEVVLSFNRSLLTKYRGALDGKINDNKWHRIQVIRTLWELSIKIDDKPALHPKSKGQLEPLLLSGDGRSRLDIDLPMFVGACWRFPAYRKGYVGCMKGFTINGVLFNLANAIDHLVMEPEKLVLKGCGSACQHKPCPFGTCVDRDTSYECDCTETPFYGTYCSKEISMKIDTTSVAEFTNLTIPPSNTEKIVLAFSSDKLDGPCSGTLFQVLSNNGSQFYKLTLTSRRSLKFEFKLLSTLPEFSVNIDIDQIDLCDTTRHILNIERAKDDKDKLINYRIDGRKTAVKRFQLDVIQPLFKPYKFYVGNLGRTSAENVFNGCISGLKLHFFSEDGKVETVEPVRRAIETNNTTCQKGALTFGNLNSFVLLNVSSLKEVKFKFRSLKSNIGSMIAAIQIPSQGDLTISLDENTVLKVGHLPFVKLNEGWHTILLEILDIGTFASVDNGEKKPVFEHPISSTVGAKLVLGDPRRECKTFIGCIKDLTVDGQDYTAKVAEAKMKEFVTEGCVKPRESVCGSQTILDTTPTNGYNGTKSSDTDDDVENVDGESDNNATIIAIVVVFSILFVILVIIFSAIWYVKRSKAVYQTNESSTEDIRLT